MGRLFWALYFFLGPSLLAAEPSEGKDLGALKVESVNIRSGPGTQFRPLWLLKRCRGYPVRVLRTFQDWSYIQDPQGSEGWVRSNFISSKASVYVDNHLEPLRNRPSFSSTTVAFLAKGVVARVEKKRGGWLYVIVLGSEERRLKGWVALQSVWPNAPSKEGSLP